MPGDSPFRSAQAEPQFLKEYLKAIYDNTKNNKKNVEEVEGKLNCLERKINTVHEDVAVMTQQLSRYSQLEQRVEKHNTYFKAIGLIMTSIGSAAAYLVAKFTELARVFNG